MSSFVVAVHVIVNHKTALFSSTRHRTLIISAMRLRWKYLSRRQQMPFAN
eukprot:m.79657 g.79657  ORF g.79657 m.79657 type:complete len:50 (+) comp20870_c0_seq3:25-174(+)